jgi:hypothetical protein
MLKVDAVKRAGGCAALAKVLGINRQAVHQWGEYIPELRWYQLQTLRPEWFIKTKMGTK